MKLRYALFGAGLGVMILDISAASIFAALVPHRLRSRVSGAYMPSAVYYPPSNKIYVFGGEDGSLGTNYALTRIYDVASNAWSTGADMC